MPTVYYYCNKIHTKDFLKYGIRLSKNFDKEINLNGYEKQCLCAFLSPKDDIDKYHSNQYDCLKLEVSYEHCKVAEGLWAHTKYYASLSIPLKEYFFGTFQKPEVFIMASILPEKIALLNKTIDVPVLFDNSKDLYFENKVSYLIDTLEKETFYSLLVPSVCKDIFYEDEHILIYQYQNQFYTLKKN